MTTDKDTSEEQAETVPGGEDIQNPQETEGVKTDDGKRKIADRIRHAIQYVTHDIWITKEHEYSSTRKLWWVRQFKVILFTLKGIGQHSTLVRSAALTFYTIMSIVPVLALAFAVAKGFGLDAKLHQYLYIEFPDYSKIINQFLGFANNMLERTKGGIIASVGVLVLFWSVLKVFGNVEKAFNSIWEVRKARSIARKFTDYLAVIIIAPILLVLSSSAGLYVKSSLADFTPYILVQILFYILSMMMIWILFTFLYIVMPNTKVKTRNAFTGGMIAGTAFMLFQSIYFALQSSLSNYNAIYSTFAAIPLFLIWLQASWQIVLFGSELSFAYQNINKYEYERLAGSMSYEFRKKVMILVMYEIVDHFLKHDGAVSSEKIANNLQLPLRTVRDVIFSLLNADLILAIVSKDDDKTHFYVPSRDVHNLRVFDIIKGTETVGSVTKEMETNPNLEPISAIIAKFDDSIINSDGNILITDIKINNARAL